MERNVGKIWSFQVRTQPLNDFEGEVFSANAAMDFINKEDAIIDFIKNRKLHFNGNKDEGSTQKQQILEELHVSTLLALLETLFLTIIINYSDI